jgi:acetyltransferase-like isoleucine patch superfamily enzyme
MVKLREIIRIILIYVRFFYFSKLFGMDIAKSARVSVGTKLDKTNPRGIHIGDETYFASGAIMLSHDFCRSIKADTHVGKRCFIGANAIIMAGVNIGDHVIVGSGSVVTKDVPANCIVAGNPAKVIRTDIWTEKFGKLRE